MSMTLTITLCILSTISFVSCASSTNQLATVTQSNRSPEGENRFVSTVMDRQILRQKY